MQKDKKKSWGRELGEWLFILGLMATLWTTGMIPRIQGWILSTGIYKPQLALPEAEQTQASYRWDLVDMNGHVFSLEESKGEVLFINFWATWCPPCIAEMPEIQALYKDISSKEPHVRFLLVSMDEDPRKVQNFLKRKGYDLPVYFPNSSIPFVYRHNSIPRTFLVNTQGKVVGRHVGIASYNTQAFKSYLNELARAAPSISSQP